MQTDFPTPQQWHAFTHFLDRAWISLPWIIGGLVVLILGLGMLQLLFGLALGLLNARRLIKRKTVFLELTPPAFQDKSPHAHEALYKVLSGLKGNRSWQDKLFLRQVLFTLAIVGTREEGIKFVVEMDSQNHTSFRKDITGLHRDIRIREVEDYLRPPTPEGRVKILEFGQTQHFSHSLKYEESNPDVDLISYVMTAMSELEPGEQVVVQFTVSPASARADRELQKSVTRSPHVLDRIGGGRKRSAGGLAAHALGGLSLGIVDLVSEAFHGPARATSYVSKATQTQEQASYANRSSEYQVVKNIQSNKIGQNLYEASIRVLILATSEQRETEYVNDMSKALGAYNIPSYQSLERRANFPYAIKGRYRMFMFRHRLPALTFRGRCKFSASEIAAIFHFPNSQSAPNVDVSSALSRRLPVPPEMRRRADNNEFDIVLGESEFQGVRTNIGLIKAEREKHMYIVGATGTGKTTLLEYAIIQDIKNGKGVGVIDPHGDMAKKILRFIPEERKKDVVYFDPSDFDHPIGLNMLELPEGLEGSVLAHEKDRVTEAIISIMRKVFEDGMEGSAHRIDRIMRKGIHTAMTIKGATLFTVLELMTSAEYRKKIAKGLKDPALRRFWKEELDPAGEMQRVKITGGPISRIDRFNQSESAKRVIGQAKSTIDFEDIMNSGKILICNFAKGRLGEDTSSLFGTTVLAKLQLASWRREELEPEDRKPFYLYVDEFQHFAGDSFQEILSEARKYKLSLTMAEQSTAQQQSQMIEVVLNNVGTVACFRTGSIQDERLMLHQFKPFVGEGEIKNLSVHNFYIKIAAEDVFPTFSGITKVLEGGSKDVADDVIETSRELYSGEYIESDTTSNGGSSEHNEKSGSDQMQNEESDDEDSLTAEDMEPTA